MEQVVLSQLRQYMTKTEEWTDKAKQLVSPETISYEQLLKTKVALQIYVERLSKTFDKYVGMTVTLEEEFTTSVIEKRTSAEEILIEIEALLQRANRPVQDQPPLLPPTPAVAHMPKLQLPKFSGNILEFSEFWDRFESAVVDKNFNDVDKMGYLLGCLNGAALDSVKGLTTTNENYKIAVEILKTRFGNKTLVIDAHFKSLDALRKANDTPEACRVTLNVIQKNLRILENLGENTNSNHLKMVITNKFPERVLYEMNVLNGDNTTAKETIQGLERIITAMERANGGKAYKEEGKPVASTAALFVGSTRKRKQPFNKEWGGPTKRVTPPWKSHPKHGKFFARPEQGKFTARPEQEKFTARPEQEKFTARPKPYGKRGGNYTTATNLPARQGGFQSDSCAFCAGEHSSHLCTKLNTVEERRNYIVRTARCFRCLDTGHYVRECRRKLTCIHCGLNHNSAICLRKGKNQPTSRKAETHMYSFNNSYSFLQTATVEVQAPNRSHKCRIILDSGSQRSYMTASLGNKLDIKPGGEDLLMVYTFGSNKPKEMISSFVDIKIVTKRGIERIIKVNIVPQITSRIPVPEASKLPVDVIADVDGVIRSKGRMENTKWTYDMKHPILIPKGAQFTHDIVREIHQKNHHVGVPHTLSLVRQKYWIPGGRTEVQRILRKCPQCTKHGGGPYQLPSTPALPMERVNFSAPFTYTGIDYFGPVYVDVGKGPEKRWICLMTCLAVRAIHMEVVENLTAEECILALRRFISMRGTPTLLVSDNALYFKLSSEVLSSELCIQNKIKWKFIPQLAPWHGGVYERMVGLVKHCMKRTLEKQLLNDSQLLTVIKEIEAVINTRPLTAVGSDLDYILKPADFLTLGKCLNLELSQDEEMPLEGTLTKKSLVEGWRKGQMLLEQFKDMFINQYLVSLRERYQHSHKQPRIKSPRVPQVGDFVQIRGESKNRINWKVGRITDLVRGSDGQCRIARVQVGDSVFTRSIGHLYPLEVDDSYRTADADSAPKPTPSGYQACTSENEPENEPDRVANFHNPEGRDSCGQARKAEVDQGNSMPEIPDLQIEVDPEEDREASTEAQANIQNEELAERREIAQDDEVMVSRPRREAAIRAREKITEWTRNLIAML